MDLFPHLQALNLAKRAKGKPHKQVAIIVPLSKYFSADLYCCVLGKVLGNNNDAFFPWPPKKQLLSLWKLIIRERASWSLQKRFLYIFQPKHVMYSRAGSYQLGMVTTMKNVNNLCFGVPLGHSCFTLILSLYGKYILREALLPYVEFFYSNYVSLYISLFLSLSSYMCMYIYVIMHI